MSGIARRGVLALGAISPLLRSTDAAAGPIAHTPPLDSSAWPLWPGRIPGDGRSHPPFKIDQRSTDPTFADRWLTGIARPMLAVRRAARPNGAAALVIPGGGYGFVSWDNEGEEQARWLNAQGIDAFLLRYRLPGEGWARRETVPLQDAQRAMRLIRSRGPAMGIDPAQVLALGFSAGGHLGGTLATKFGEVLYAPVDAADRLSARPDLVALVYPVISFVESVSHGNSRDNLLGPGHAEELRRPWSVEHAVSASTPPVFLAHASDDGLVPIANSVMMYQAMVAAGRPAELHAFDQGGHGFGARLDKKVPASAWPDLLVRFARRHDLLR